jgi:hypothetical protein
MHAFHPRGVSSSSSSGDLYRYIHFVTRHIRADQDVNFTQLAGDLAGNIADSTT